MNKLNKKGFTLIEMLVVIAIIAVLVSIVIPTVTSATDKAAAAANAANLRSVKAEMVTTLLTEGNSASVRGVSLAATTGNDPVAPTSAPTGVTFKDLDSVTAPSGVTFTGTFNKDHGFRYKISASDEVVVYYDGLTVNDWAAVAGK